MIISKNIRELFVVCYHIQFVNLTIQNLFGEPYDLFILSLFMILWFSQTCILIGTNFHIMRVVCFDPYLFQNRHYDKSKNRHFIFNFCCFNFTRIRNSDFFKIVDHQYIQLMILRIRLKQYFHIHVICSLLYIAARHFFRAAFGVWNMGIIVYASYHHYTFKKAQLSVVYNTHNVTCLWDIEINKN